MLGSCRQQLTLPERARVFFLWVSTAYVCFREKKGLRREKEGIRKRRYIREVEAKMRLQRLYQLFFLAGVREEKVEWKRIKERK